MANIDVPVKPGYKTTEFWVTIIVQIIGLAAATGYITSEQSGALSDATVQLGGIITMVASAFGYAISRGIAKKQ